MTATADVGTDRPVVLRGGTVLTMDDAHRCSRDTDVLVVGDRIAAVGPAWRCPRAPSRSTPRDGIVMPGMIDTHRHMWQTAMRGYGADWTLTQYFVWYYLESGRHFRPQDVHAGNLLAAIEAIDAGVTTCVDWSHGLQTIDHAEAAVDALRSVPGRFVLAYGNIQQAPWEWSTSPEFRAFARRRIDAADDMLGFQMAFDVTGDPAFPERAAYEVARELGVPGHHPRRRLGRDQRRRHPARARGRLPRRAQRLRARRHALGRLLPPHRRHRRLGVGVHRERAERRPGLPAHLGAARARHPGVAVDGHQRLVERRPVLRDAHHARRRPLARAPRGARQGRDRHPLLAARRAGRRVGDPRRRPRARAATASSAASSPARRPTSCCSRTTHSPVSFPLLNPYGHVAFQAQRGDVHTVLVDGRVVKHEHRLVGVDLAAARREVEATVEHLRSTLGEEAWAEGHEPRRPRDHDPRQPLHLHRLPQRQHPRPLIRRKDRREMRGARPREGGKHGSGNDHERHLDQAAYRS